jgi:hypothetical protein
MATWKKLLTEVDYGVLTSAIATAQNTANLGQTAGQVSTAIATALQDYSLTADIVSTYATNTALNAAISDISDLESDYSTLSSTVSSNTTAINTNTGNIATNASGIATNVADITTNAGDITTNANAIAAINTSLGDYAELDGAVFTGNVEVIDLKVTGTLDVQTINYASTTQTEILIEDFTITVGSNADGAADTLNGAGLKVNASGLTGVTSDYGLFYQNSGTYSKFELGAENSGDYVGVVRSYNGTPNNSHAAAGKFAVNVATGDMYIAIV